MDLPDVTLERVGRTAGYLALGLVGTAAVALALLYVTRPVQAVLYDLVYLQVGPSEATETAVLTHSVAAGLTAVSAAMLLGDYLGHRLAHRDSLGRAIAAMGGLVLVFLAVALGGFAAFLTALAVLAAAFVGVPVALRYRYGVRSGGVLAFVGGVPVVVLLLLLVGFGLGWGWGYVVTAREVPASSVDGTAPPAFDDAPEVGEDLFDADNCETDAEGRRVCRLLLRGYDHEVAAARSMARRGVRCPYQNAQAPVAEASYVARHDGTAYRISCGAYGD